MRFHGHLNQSGQLPVRGFGEYHRSGSALVDPSVWNLRGSCYPYLDPSRVAEIDDVWLVVVGLFPFGIPQCDSLVNAAELGIDDALHGQRG